MEDPQDNPAPTPSDDEEEVVPPSQLVGQLFGRFRCIRKLGQGAMATVLLGEDIALKRPAALKLLPRINKSNPQHRVWLDQFIREARAAAQLMHGGIVQVYEVGLHAGYFYIAMEAVLGGSLEERVRKSGPLPVAQAVDFLLQAADALAFAHQRGVLHRDIKPANILLTERGQCKLGDFGMAIIDDPSDKFKLPGNWLGTPYFMAPEMLARRSSVQSDIYALGATLWYLLTARYPYAIKDYRDVTYVGERFLLGDLRKLCPQAPPALAKVLAKALARNPEDRFIDVPAIAAALRDAMLPTGLDALAAASRHPRGTAATPQAAALARSGPGFPDSSRPANRPAAKVRQAGTEKPSAKYRWAWIAGIFGAVVVAAVILLILQPWRDKKNAPSATAAEKVEAPVYIPLAAPPIESPPSIPLAESLTANQPLAPNPPPPSGFKTPANTPANKPPTAAKPPHKRPKGH